MKRFIEILTIPFWLLYMLYDILFPTKVDIDKYFKEQSKTNNHDNNNP